MKGHLLTPAEVAELLIRHVQLHRDEKVAKAAQLHAAQPANVRPELGRNGKPRCQSCGRFHTGVCYERHAVCGAYHDSKGPCPPWAARKAQAKPAQPDLRSSLNVLSTLRQGM